MAPRRKLTKAKATSTNQPEAKPEDKSLSSLVAEQQPEPQAINEKARKLKANVDPRRSMRLQNVVVPPPELGRQHLIPVAELERIIAEVTFTDSEKEEDYEYLAVDEAKLPESTLKNFHEKVDQLTSIVKGVQGQTKSSTSKNARNEKLGSEVRYKNLYLESQKKVEALVDEKYELTLKLERALGKLEAYETTTPFSAALEKLNELILAINLVKATETTNVTSQAISDALDGSHETRKFGMSDVSFWMASWNMRKLCGIINS
ncbi:hypothetical protein ACFE04_031547 [Oxalis oulophora]